MLSLLEGECSNAPQTPIREAMASQQGPLQRIGTATSDIVSGVLWWSARALGVEGSFRSGARRAAQDGDAGTAHDSGGGELDLWGELLRVVELSHRHFLLDNV